MPRENIVADFGAFLSVVVDGEKTLEDRDGRVVMSREDLIFGCADGRERLSISSLMEFDFRTVPPEWEQFFDDLVGIRFERDSEEVIVTIGTDTETADRFVTILLKLILEETTARVRQRLVPLSGEKPEPSSEETTMTLLPRSERIRFDEGEIRPIDIATITGVDRADESRSVLVRHLGSQGRLITEITPEARRDAHFLQTYLDFRSELATGSGPVHFLFVGNDRDTLVAIAKRLQRRNLDFEAAHARSLDEVAETLDSVDVPTECVVSEYDLGDGDGTDLRQTLQERDIDVPIVLLKDDSHSASGHPDADGIEMVTVDSSAGEYEGVVDAIERAIVAARVD